MFICIATESLWIINITSCTKWNAYILDVGGTGLFQRAVSPTLTWAETWRIHRQLFPDTPPRYLHDWLPTPVKNAWKHIQIHTHGEDLIPALLHNQSSSYSRSLAEMDVSALQPGDAALPHLIAGNTSHVTLPILGDTWPRYVLGFKNRNITFKNSICSGRTRNTRSLGHANHCRISVCSQAAHIRLSCVISTTARHQIRPKLPFFPFSRGMLERHNPCDGWIDTIRSNLIHV